MTFWDDGVILLRLHPNRKFPSNFVRWPLKAERLLGWKFLEKFSYWLPKR